MSRVQVFRTLFVAWLLLVLAAAVLVVLGLAGAGSAHEVLIFVLTMAALGLSVGMRRLDPASKGSLRSHYLRRSRS